MQYSIWTSILGSLLGSSGVVRGPVHGTGHRRRGTRSPFPGLDGSTGGQILPRAGIESEMLDESHDTAAVVREHFKGGRLSVRHSAAARAGAPFVNDL